MLLCNGKQVLGLHRLLQVPFQNNDAAMLIGMSEKEYSDYMRDKTAVAKGTDFVYRNIRYQEKPIVQAVKREVK